MSKSMFRRGFCVLFFIYLILLDPSAFAQTFSRFFYAGDGIITLNGEKIRFRLADGSYDEQGLKRIHQIFNANWNDPDERLSLRFIEILDYVQDHFNGKPYVLKSGYRSPNLNQELRDQGKLAAQSSMHIEGAAADLLLVGVNSSEVFEYVKSLDCCGIGWYHSRHFHLDSGPPRYWDELTSKTEDKTPQQNEKIILQPDYDRYRPGESIALKFMRVSQYPFGVPAKFELVKIFKDHQTNPQDLAIQFANDVSNDKGCMTLESRKQSRNLKAKLPNKGLEPGQYALKLKFCNRYHYEKMPEEILSRIFEIQTNNQ
jgi:uncharacterized protein YcbK (DUF882 family)